MGEVRGAGGEAVVGGRWWELVGWGWWGVGNEIWNIVIMTQSGALLYNVTLK